MEAVDFQLLFAAFRAPLESRPKDQKGNTLIIYRKHIFKRNSILDRKEIPQYQRQKDAVQN